MSGKGSKRRPCLVSRAEYNLRWDYAYGRITRREFDTGLKAIKSGNCIQCKHGAMIGPDYKITCLVTHELHDQHHSCPNFEGEK